MSDDIRTELQQHVEYHREQAETSAQQARNARDAAEAAALGSHAVTHAILALTRAVQATGPTGHIPLKEQLTVDQEDDERAAAEEAFLARQRTTARMLFNLRQRASISGEFPSGHSYSYPFVRIVAVDDDGFEVDTTPPQATERNSILRLEWSGLRRCERAARV